MKYLKEIKDEVKRLALSSEFSKDEDIVGLFRGDGIIAIVVEDLISITYRGDSNIDEVRCSYLGDRELIDKFNDITDGDL